MSQVFIKSESNEGMEDYRKRMVASIGENISVRRFVRYELGDGLEKKSDDFAAEVAAQTEKKEEAAAPAPAVRCCPAAPLALACLTVSRAPPRGNGFPSLLLGHRGRRGRCTSGLHAVGLVVHRFCGAAGGQGGGQGGGGGAAGEGSGKARQGAAHAHQRRHDGLQESVGCEQQ